MTIEEAKKRKAFLQDCLVQVHGYSDDELDIIESEIEVLMEFINESEHDEFENY